MALIIVSSHLEKSEAMLTTFRFLKKEYNAEISIESRQPGSVSFLINGKGLPEGNTPMDITVEEVVPNVFAITVSE